jgi:hypothetical protein
MIIIICVASTVAMVMLLRYYMSGETGEKHEKSQSG